MIHMDEFVCSVQPYGVRLHIRGAFFRKGYGVKRGVFTREVSVGHYTRTYGVSTATIPLTAFVNIWKTRL